MQNTKISSLGAQLSHCMACWITVALETTLWSDRPEESGPPHLVVAVLVKLGDSVLVAVRDALVVGVLV